jgi:RecT family.
MQRVCNAFATFRGDKKPTVYTSPELQILQAGNSPLWKTDPDQQMAYFSARAWARKFCPEVLLGVYTPDEVRDMREDIRDITPSGTSPGTSSADVLAGLQGDDSIETDATPTPQTAVTEIRENPEVVEADPLPSEPTPDATTGTEAGDTDADDDDYTSYTVESVEDPAADPEPAPIKHDPAAVEEWQVTADWLRKRSGLDAFNTAIEDSRIQARIENARAAGIDCDADLAAIENAFKARELTDQDPQKGFDND